MRFRLQFTLRTVFIVLTLLAIPLGYVGWQAKIVRERKEMRTKIQALSGIVETPEAKLVVSPRWADPLPIVRRWLGDEPVHFVVISKRMLHSDVEAAKDAFPEAAFYPPIDDWMK